MTGNGIGDEGTKAMSEILTMNKTLTTLNLWSDKEKKRKEEKQKRKSKYQEIRLDLKEQEQWASC